MGKKSQSKLGHTKLEVGFQRLVDQLSQRFSVILRKIANNRNEELQFGRFLSNPKVSPTALLEHQWQQNPVDLTGKHILVVGDTCTMSFEEHEKRKNLGYIGPNSKKNGFKTHPSLLLDADHGALYGVGAIKVWSIATPDTSAQVLSSQEEPSTVTTKPLSKSSERKKRLRSTPFSQKEPYVWHEVPKMAIQNCPIAQRYTLVGDSETDIYDLFVLAQNSKVDFVYRCKHDRAIEHPEFTKLSELLTSWSIQKTYNLEVEATKKRTKHKAKMELKFGQVQIKRPTWQPKKGLPDTVTIYVVEAKEHASIVVPGEQPLHWILFTSHIVQIIKDAFQIIEWYKWRWTIEQLFRSVKTKGLDIEHARVENPAGLANLATLALLAAVKVMQLVQARDLVTEQNIAILFSQNEQQTLIHLNAKVQGNTNKLKNPHPSQSLAFGAWVIARLGGWSGYQKQPPPGPITMIRGLVRFYDIMTGVNLFLI